MSIMPKEFHMIVNYSTDSNKLLGRRAEEYNDSLLN